MLAVGRGLASGADRGAVRHDVQVPLGGVHVGVLELRVAASTMSVVAVSGANARAHGEEVPP